MGEFFSADMKINQDDFQRQVDEARNVTVTAELKQWITNQHDVASAMRDAKWSALVKARRKLAQALYDQYQAKVDQNLLPFGASQEVNAWLDEGTVKVQA